MTSRYIGQINAKYNSTDIIITPDRAAADQDGAPIVNTTGAQTISGAKTFSGSTTFTGKVTASNTGNSLKVANHNSVLTSNDVLSAKDINTPNGDANNLLHRSGNEGVDGTKEFTGNVQFDAKCQLNSSNPYLRICDTGLPTKGSTVSSNRISKILFQAADNSTLVENQFRTYASGTTNETIQVINQAHTYYANFVIEINTAGKATLTLDLYNSSGTKLKSATIATLEA